MRIVLHQQHAGFMATPSRALVREGNGWDPPGRLSWRNGLEGGRGRGGSPAGRVPRIPFDKRCQEKQENSERGGWNQNPMVRSLHEGRGQIRRVLVSQVLHFRGHHDCSCPASRLYPPNPATGRIPHIELEISAIQRIYEKYFTLVPPEIISFSSFICFKRQESAALMRCTKACGQLNSFIVPH